MLSILKSYILPVVIVGVAVIGAQALAKRFGLGA